MQQKIPLLQVTDLSVTYGAFKALSNVSWNVSAGEVLGIIGPNGAGKSTCFDATTNMVRRSGKVELNGQDITDVPAHELPWKGVRRTFQQNAFFAELSVLENMTGVLLAENGSPLLEATFLPWLESRRRRKTEAAARDILIRFGLPEEYHQLTPNLIPYGTQRFLSIALAFGAGAKVILLDEPAAGLGGTDMAKLKSILLLLRQQGSAVVLIEHHMDLVMSVADRIHVLDLGETLATGSPAEVQKNPHVLEAYLGRS